MKRIVLTLIFAVLVVYAWGQDKTTIDLSKYNLTAEDVRLLEQAINEIREFAYFRGQVDAKNGDWKIKPVPETGAYQWSNVRQKFSEDELQFFKRFEPKLNFKSNNSATPSIDNRAKFPTRNEIEQTSASCIFNLRNRNIVGNFPIPTYSVNVSGVVVVEVIVDKNGNVTQASYRPQDSTTDNAELIKSSLTAAKRARFTSGDDEQVGTITYNFKLQ
ncbi:TonB family protein [uncultured Alistipes sp.]|jgi:tonB family C-terminal domain|uniref:TonB family protein n=1 Tax=uncultured Alistipes sp. TaxID=538949 RepID=UPI0025EA7038|nr:TonB family protein [uncultured Alistipes sp.]